MNSEIDVITALSNADRTIDPENIYRSLVQANNDVVAGAFQEARSLGQRAWIAMAICVGIAQERAGTSEQSLKDLASMFKMHRSRVNRFGRIYSEIIKPRIENDDFSFAIGEVSFYEIAVDAAHRTGKPALELIERAEDHKLSDSSYSTRNFRDELSGRSESPDAPTDPQGAISQSENFAKLVDELAAIPDDVITAFIEQSVNPRDWLSTITAAKENVDRTRTGLMDKAGLVRLRQ